ncbi:MAG: hypothetical protein AAF089_13185 [Bacteroidota bacterium]
MMKEAVRALEVGALSEIGLIAFVVAFLCGCAIAFFGFSKSERATFKNLPLDDDDILTPTE